MAHITIKILLSWINSRFLLLGLLALLYPLLTSRHYSISHRALLINIIKIWLTHSLCQLPATLALLYFPPLVITLTSLLIIALNFCSHLLDSPLINDPFLFSFISHHFCLSAHHCPQRSAHLLPGSLFLLLNLGVLASLYFILYPVLLLCSSSKVCSSAWLTVSAPWCTSLALVSCRCSRHGWCVTSWNGD